MPNYWTCKMRCTAKRAMPQAKSPEDNLYTFVNIDSDGSLTQIIESDYFCQVGDIVNIRISPTTYISSEKTEELADMRDYQDVL